MLSLVHVQAESDVIVVSNDTGATLEGGSVVAVGNKIGVLIADIEDGATGTARIGGVVSLTKKDAITPAQGDQVFWDSDPGEITGTAADGVPAGTVFEAPEAGDSEVKVLLNDKAAGAHVANTAAADVATLVTDFNGLLTALRNAGVLKSS
jgi:predicted RecA/RadA family phage recombinase